MPKTLTPEDAALIDHAALTSNDPNAKLSDGRTVREAAEAYAAADNRWEEKRQRIHRERERERATAQPEQAGGGQGDAQEGSGRRKPAAK